MIKKIAGKFINIVSLLKPVIAVNITINSDNKQVTSVGISETKDINKINKAGLSAKQDDLVKFGSSDSLWVCEGKGKDSKKYFNIGKYYSCTVSGKEIVFWLGAEAMENDAYVKLYINEAQLPKQSKQKASETGVFELPIDEFSSSASQKKLETALNKKLKTFLQDIFNDT